MNFVDRLLGTFLWLLSVAVVAGITHITTIFGLPAFMEQNPLAEIAARTKTGEVTLLPPPQADRPSLPFTDPAMVQAICPFDLAEGGLRLHAEPEVDRLLALSFRTSTGQVFYSMSDLAAQQGKIDVVVLTPAELEAVESDDDEDNPTQDLRLIAQDSKGFVVISALAEFPSEKAQAEALVKSVSCAVEPIAEE